MPEQKSLMKKQPLLSEFSSRTSRSIIWLFAFAPIVNSIVR